MATTTNLKLTLLEGASVVDYNQINAYVKAFDALGKDYVTEVGTKGNYWYRIWKSGRCECGVDNRRYFDSLPLDRSWGGTTGIWITNGRIEPFGDYPRTFVARPYANICFNYCTEAASCLVIQSQTMGGTKAPAFVLGNSQSIVLHDVQLSIFCTGRIS